MKRISLILFAIFGYDSTQNSAKLQDYNYYVDTKINYVSIRGYSGNDTEIIIPEEIEGKPVKYIGTFQKLYNFKSIAFLGNAPEDFNYESLNGDVEIHYKKGTLGWDSNVFSRYKMVDFE